MKTVLLSSLVSLLVPQHWHIRFPLLGESAETTGNTAMLSSLVSVVAKVGDLFCRVLCFVVYVAWMYHFAVLVV